LSSNTTEHECDGNRYQCSCAAAENGITPYGYGPIENREYRDADAGRDDVLYGVYGMHRFLGWPIWVIGMRTLLFDLDIHEHVPCLARSTDMESAQKVWSIDLSGSRPFEQIGPS
jgi:hypothetical protein